MPREKPSPSVQLLNEIVRYRERVLENGDIVPVDHMVHVNKEPVFRMDYSVPGC